MQCALPRDLGQHLTKIKQRGFDERKSYEVEERCTRGGQLRAVTVVGVVESPIL